MEVAMSRATPKFLILAASLFLAMAVSGGRSVGASPIVHTHEAVFAYRDAHPGEAVPVIVRTAPSADPARTVEIAGGQVYSDLGFIHGVAAAVPYDRLDAL